MEKQVIISISREFGSGGHEIAEKIAKNLGFHFYDRSMLDDLAREKNLLCPAGLAGTPILWKK